MEELRTIGAGTSSVLAWASAIVVTLVLLAVSRRAHEPAIRRAATVASVATFVSLVPTERFAWVGLLVGALFVTSLLATPLGAQLVRWRALRRARAVILRMPARRFVLAAALTSLVVTTLLSLAQYRGLPVIPDSEAQLFHARILASGRLVAEPPPCADFFVMDHVIVREHAWYSQYPPAHIVMLTLGVLLGAPFLVCPVLGALTVVLVHGLARHFSTERIARRATLFALCSPFFLSISSEAMNHASSLFFATLFAWALARTLERASLAAALTCGLALGGVALTRPLTAIAIAPAFALLVLTRLRRALVAPLALAAITAAATGALLLVWNDATNGAPTLMGYVVRWGPDHTLGFHASPWGSPHTPMRGLTQSIANLAGLDLYLLGGALPGVFLVVLGTLHAWREPWVRALAGAALTLLVVHFFYFFQDLTFGPRFLYEALPLCAIACAHALTALRSMLSARLARAWLASGALVALTLFAPLLVREHVIGYALSPGIVERAEETLPPGERALVLVAEPMYRAFHVATPDLDSRRIIYGLDLGDARVPELAACFPERSVWAERPRLRLVRLSGAPR